MQKNVVEFRDVMKQQLEEDMQSKVDDTVKKELSYQVCGDLDEVKKAIQETK